MRFLSKLKNAVKEKFNVSKVKVVGATTALATTAGSLGAVVASASDGTNAYSGLDSAMTSGFTTAKDAMMTSMGNIVPIVVVVAGGIAVIYLGFRLFKRFTK